MGIISGMIAPWEITTLGLLHKTFGPIAQNSFIKDLPNERQVLHPTQLPHRPHQEEDG